MVTRTCSDCPAPIERRSKQCRSCAGRAKGKANVARLHQTNAERRAARERIDPITRTLAERLLLHHSIAEVHAKLSAMLLTPPTLKQVGEWRAAVVRRGEAEPIVNARYRPVLTGADGCDNLHIATLALFERTAKARRIPVVTAMQTLQFGAHVVAKATPAGVLPTVAGSTGGGRDHHGRASVSLSEVA